MKKCLIASLLAMAAPALQAQSSVVLDVSFTPQSASNSQSMVVATGNKSGLAQPEPVTAPGSGAELGANLVAYASVPSDVVVSEYGRSQAPQSVFRGNLTIYPDGAHAFQMSPGLLRPQLTELLLHHASINEVVWGAEENLQWTSHFSVEGQSMEQVINEILRAYGLMARFYRNHVVTVEGVR